MTVVCFHNPSEENGYLSNWYPCRFTVEGVDFSSMEQYMMYKKAVYFGDKAVAAQILATDDVAEIKALGRLVAHYSERRNRCARRTILQKTLSLFPLYRLLPQMKSRPPKKSGDLHFYRLSL